MSAAHPHDRLIVAVVAALVAAGAVAGHHGAVTSDEPAGAAAPRPRRRARGAAAALARSRRPRRPRGRRPARGACASTRRASARRPRSSSPRHDSLEARVGQAFSRWPNGTVAGLTQLAGLHPKSAAVQLNLGIARFWAGRGGAQGRVAVGGRSLEPDTAYAVTAGNLLYPDFARNLPIFVPVERGAGGDVRKLAAPASWRCSSGARETGTIADRLFYGVALQRLGKQLLGRARLRARPRRRRRTIPEAQVAAAVGLFDKAQPGRRRSPGSGRSRATLPEGRHGPLPPRPAAALVGPGEGGAAPARARPHGRARARRSSAWRSATWTELRKPRASDADRPPTPWGIF